MSRNKPPKFDLGTPTVPSADETPPKTAPESPQTPETPAVAPETPEPIPQPVTEAPSWTPELAPINTTLDATPAVARPHGPELAQLRSGLRSYAGKLARTYERTQAAEQAWAHAAEHASALGVDASALLAALADAGVPTDAPPYVAACAAMQVHVPAPRSPGA